VAFFFRLSFIDGHNICLYIKLMIPTKQSPIWKKIVDSQIDFHLSGLATKMLLTRVRLMTKNDPEKISEAIDIAHDFFTRNEKLVSDDVKKIFAKVNL